jgi:hypothetical protein
MTNLQSIHVGEVVFAHPRHTPLSDCIDFETNKIHKGKIFFVQEATWNEDDSLWDIILWDGESEFFNAFKQDDWFAWADYSTNKWARKFQNGPIILYRHLIK